MKERATRERRWETSFAEPKRLHIAQLVAFTVVMAAALATCVIVDGYLRHGLHVDWRTMIDGKPELITRTMERNPSFPTSARVFNRYFANWPYERFGVPAEPPAVDVIARGQITLDETRDLSFIGSGAREISVVSADGEVLEGLRNLVRVKPGTYDVTLKWRSAMNDDLRGVWNWRTSAEVSDEVAGEEVPGEVTDDEGQAPQGLVPDGEQPEIEPAGPWEEIPREAFTPAGEDGARTTLWSAGLLLGLLFALLAAYVIDEEFTVTKRKLFHFVALAILVSAAGLRLHEHGTMPDPRENYDELFAMWNGHELIESGSTVGWTIWLGYYGGHVEHEWVNFWREHPTALIRPYLEHPPLFHLMVGAVSHLEGADTFMHSRTQTVRLFMIAISLLTLCLVMAIARRLYGDGAALLAGGIYAFVPNIVLQTRVIKGDALIGLLMAAVVLLYLRWLDSRSRRTLIFASILASLATLAKLPAVVVTLVLLALVVRKLWDESGRLKTVLRGVLPVVIPAAIVWGVFFLLIAVTVWKEFWFSQSLQATVRAVLPDTLSWLFYSPEIDHDAVGRGPILFLWIGTIATLVQHRYDHRFGALSLAIVGWCLAIALPAGSWRFGWYYLPLFPFLAIGAGVFLKSLYERENLLGAFAFVALVVCYLLQFEVEVDVRDEASRDLARAVTFAIVLGVMVPAGLFRVMPGRVTRRLWRTSLLAALALSVVMSARFVLAYPDLDDERIHNIDRHE